MVSFREWLREAEYKEYFKKILAKYNVEDPSELSKEDKQKFFDEIDAGWEGANEEPEAGDVNESADKAKKFMKEFNSAISMLKDDIKNADKNQDWYVRLEYIVNMIQRELKNK